MKGMLDFIEEHILQEILLLIWLLCIWKLYLALRQRSLMVRSVDMPKEVENLMTKEVYDKARTYALDKINFGLVSVIYSKVYTTVFLLTLAYHHFWEYSIGTVTYLGLNPENEILVSGIFMFLIDIPLELMYLPVKVYTTFVLEQKHGFNKQKPLFFVKDQLLQLAVAQMIKVPIFVAIIWIVKHGGDYFFLYMWVFCVIAAIFLMIIYPEVIAPLFDKYSPLPDGELKTKIEALASSVEFPLYKLFIVEGSRRSSHSNAYLYGFHKHKRIVLFDTLVKEYYKPAEGAPHCGCETDEVLAVLAHEIGHWKYSHTLKGFFAAQVSFIICTLLYAKLLHYSPMYTAFGFTDSQPTIIGLIIVTSYILIPLNTVMEVLSVVVSRRFEFQADAFARTLGHGEALRRALIKLEKDNLGFPLYDKLYSCWHRSHPPLLQRLEAISKDD